LQRPDHSPALDVDVDRAGRHIGHLERFDTPGPVAASRGWRVEDLE
jgi:hypothetical protein